jgi:uncharacterized RDD family membrane protein YckC
VNAAEGAILPVPGMAYAGFGSRLISLIIDSIIVGVANFIIQYAVTAAIGSQALFAVIAIVITLAYTVYFFTSTGQTLGMKMLGIKAVDANGHVLSTGAAVIRFFGAWVSVIIIFIGYVMMLWDGRKQTLHDKFAGSFIVKA